MADAFGHSCASVYWRGRKVLVFYNIYSNVQFDSPNFTFETGGNGTSANPFPFRIGAAYSTIKPTRSWLVARLSRQSSAPLPEYRTATCCLFLCTICRFRWEITTIHPATAIIVYCVAPKGSVADYYQRLIATIGELSRVITSGVG